MDLKYMQVSDILRSHEERIGSIELLIRWIPIIWAIIGIAKSIQRMIRKKVGNSSDS